MRGVTPSYEVRGVTPSDANIKHGYSLMVREARGDILNPGAQISKAGAEFMPPGAQYISQGHNTGAPGAGFFNYVSPGGWTCQVMHSGHRGSGPKQDWKTETEREEAQKGMANLVLGVGECIFFRNQHQR